MLTVMTHGQARFWKDDISAWEHAVAVTSPNYFSEYNLARADAAQNRNDEALVHNRECIRLDPTRVEACNNLAVLPMDRGGYDEAESALRSALRIDPQFALARSNMGLLLGKLQRYDEGFRYHREALQMDPENPEFRRNCASSHCDFGIALEGKGQLDDAVAEFQSAFSVDGEFWQAYFNLAVAYERLHRLDAGD
jgi:tetratricopeptide (TPR) repeat protein